MPGISIFFPVGRSQHSVTHIYEYRGSLFEKKKTTSSSGGVGLASFTATTAAEKAIEIDLHLRGNDIGSFLQGPVDTQVQKSQYDGNECSMQVGHGQGRCLRITVAVPLTQRGGRDGGVRIARSTWPPASFPASIPSSIPLTPPSRRPHPTAARANAPAPPAPSPQRAQMPPPIKGRCSRPWGHRPPPGSWRRSAPACRQRPARSQTRRGPPPCGQGS